MKKITLLLTLLTLLISSERSMAWSAHKLEKKSEEALSRLYKNNPKAQELGNKAIAVLVFPEIIKGALIFGASRGDGVLFEDGRVAAYYNTSSASYGLQLGIQRFGYVLFFMNKEALSYLKKSEGFELGGAPSLVVLDAGASGSLSTTTLQDGIYALFFSQRGLMASLSLQGTKITEFVPTK
ncbi:MAG: lipid-binding SYLF domain-containing protein [Chthoniobacterales bacterium]|nr:lipid-binding SYLF domain-containing protein [Chthoniobacterales bacterium]